MICGGHFYDLWRADGRVNRWIKKSLVTGATEHFGVASPTYLMAATQTRQAALNKIKPLRSTN
ncbi:hypothetical protein ASN18_1395 [Candidatus Magnetominusculus xianensis]|uniref:Uncharacterized protein n=1 Tax=Candidatus Magnetominusculus xianensis TaxID=1748249 RepID=A0ABR5SH59_9BACT|nr:hypothetical protein ASN18_1395 [Candidatus Magnetominusculus xianensis]